MGKVLLSTSRQPGKYPWQMVDGCGVLKYVDKTRLVVDHDYQRSVSRKRIKLYATNWSWIACGVVIVGYRGGEYFDFLNHS
jgi:hypothetical protein